MELRKGAFEKVLPLTAGSITKLPEFCHRLIRRKCCKNDTFEAICGGFIEVERAFWPEFQVRPSWRNSQAGS